MGVLLIMTGCSKEIKQITYEGNLIFNSMEDFEEGKLENTIINNDGEIILEDSHLRGKYISPIINTEEFSELVASWNVDTPVESEVELLIKVGVGDEWSQWFSYGKWSHRGQRGSVKGQKDEIGKLSIDTLEILNDKFSNGIMYSIELTREDEKSPSPRVRNIFLALKLKEDTKKVFALKKEEYLVDLHVPERSQMIVPEIGNVICSPTSLSMVLEYYGLSFDTEKVAENVLDKEANIYGNWSYNVAYGGTKAKYSYVARFSSVDDIKIKISKGIPVVASIKTKSEDTLIGAPQTYPYGHLIVIRGFKEKDGEEYIIVNDPAAPEVETVRREYKVSDFEKAWNKIVYIISQDFIK